MKKGVSVILCTYNGVKRLEQTLKYLVDQKINIPCEIILVDNASLDGTKEFVDSWWKQHGSKHIAYLSFEQPIPGKSYAQDLGYEKAQYEYLLVCDDDNWLGDTYVQTAFEIMESNNKIGALGGWCESVFEKEKPIWFDAYARFFAVAKQGQESGDITNKKGCLYGAGMVIRKVHWLELKHLGFKHLLTCRKGNNLSSGGDTEYSYALRLLDYKIWYDERLYFKHFMTKQRLSLVYLSRLRKVMVYSNFILWPYLDLLTGRSAKFKSYVKRSKHGFPNRPFYNLKMMLSNNYEEQEQAKVYFRTIFFTFWYYKRYKFNRTFIETWLSYKNK